MAAVTKIEGLGGDGDTATSDLGPVMHEVVYNRLREALIAGRLPPGRALSVRGLAAEFDVSAMPAREAIRRLAALGALEFTDTRRVMIAKMTGEKLFVDGDVLHTGRLYAGNNIDHTVDHQERVTVRDQFHDPADIHLVQLFTGFQSIHPNCPLFVPVSTGPPPDGKTALPERPACPIRLRRRERPA